MTSTLMVSSFRLIHLSAKLVLSVFVALIFSVHHDPARAAFSDCDAQLSDTERETRKTLELLAPLRAIFAISEGCSTGKRLMDRLVQRSGNQTSKITSVQIESALEEEGLPAAGIRNCLWAFDASSCKQYLNIREAGSRAKSAKDVADDYAGRLGATTSPGQKFSIDSSLAFRGILLCENALNRSKTYLDPLAESSCKLAEKNIEMCLKDQNSFKANQAELQKVIDSGQLGDSAPQYMVYARAEVHPCQTTLNTTGRSPGQSLAEAVARFENSGPEVLTRGSSSAGEGLRAAADRSAKGIESNSYLEATRASLNAAEQRSNASTSGSIFGAFGGVAVSLATARDPRLAQILSATGLSGSNVAPAVASAAEDYPVQGASTTQTSSPQNVSVGAASASSDFATCQLRAANPELQAAMQRLSPNDAVLQLRGAIVGIDYALSAFGQCAGDSKARQAIQSLTAQRAQTLQVCRQMSSTDRCLVSPFGKSF